MKEFICVLMYITAYAISYLLLRKSYVMMNRRFDLFGRCACLIFAAMTFVDIYAGISIGIIMCGVFWMVSTEYFDKEAKW